jgi:hypothetical protein
LTTFPQVCFEFLGPQRSGPAFSVSLLLCSCLIFLLLWNKPTQERLPQKVLCGKLECVGDEIQSKESDEKVFDLLFRVSRRIDRVTCDGSILGSGKL